MSEGIIALLPTPLREHVGFAGLRHDRVLLLVESAAWATRARMEQTRILAAVQSLGLAASSVTARVTPLPAPADDPASRPLPPRRTAQTLRAAATAISDPEIRTLLEQLADGERPLQH